jgi:aryl-alcohol dehydrogenase
MKIRAAVLRGEDAAYSLEDVELTEPGPDEVLVRITAAGHCHTDALPRAGTGFGTPPIVLGHEGAGVVAAVGSAVHTVALGDHVLLSFNHCGTCANCRAAHPAYCDTFLQRNLSGRAPDGSTPISDAAGEPIAGRWFGQSSFATHAVVYAKSVVAVNQSLPLEVLAPLGCGVQTGAGAVFDVLGVQAGDGIVVTGVGAVGLSAIMAARAAGATTIIAADVNTARLALALELGATHIVVARTGTLAEQIRAVVPNGVRYGLDTTGVPTVIAAALQALSVRGVLGMVGVQQGDLTIPPLALTAGRTLTGILEGDANPQIFIPPLIDLWLAGHFPLEKLVATFPLAEINLAEKQALAGEITKPVFLP